MYIEVAPCCCVYCITDEAILVTILYNQSDICRRVGQVSSSFPEAAAGSQKKKLKKVKSSMKLQNVFRRVSQAGRSQEDDHQQQQQRKELTTTAGQLFGRHLQDLCRGEEGAVSLPFPVVVSCVLRSICSLFVMCYSY